MNGVWRALERAGGGALALAGWCYLAMTALICFDIVARRMLGFSSGATSELSGYLLAVGMTWGLAAALFERTHVRIDMLVQKLPLVLRSVLHAAALLALLVVSGFFAWGAVALTIDSWQLNATDVSQLRTPLAVPQAVWAAGFVFLFVATLALCARVAALMIRRQLQQAESLVASRNYEEEVAETLEATRDAK
jgi:TRAP-type C4-dicarboxylate transport system permease small subunit